jgi:hypothetical protein
MLDSVIVTRRVGLAAIWSSLHRQNREFKSGCVGLHIYVYRLTLPEARSVRRLTTPASSLWRKREVGHPRAELRKLRHVAVQQCVTKMISSNGARIRERTSIRDLKCVLFLFFGHPSCKRLHQPKRRNTCELRAEVAPPRARTAGCGQLPHVCVTDALQRIRIQSGLRGKISIT